MIYVGMKSDSNMTKKLAIGGTLLAAIVSVNQAHADTTYDFSVKAGYLYDSNVSVTDLELNSMEGDSATELSFKASAKKVVNDDLTLRAKFRYSDKSYDKFSEFDLKTSVASVDGSYRIMDKGKLGLSYHVIDGELAGESYLSMKRLAPSYGMSINDCVYLRGEVAFTEKEFDSQPERDSDNETLSVTAFYFKDGAKSMWSASYKKSSEDAVSDQFDYEADELKVTYKQSINLIEGKKSDIKLGLGYQSRDYDSELSAGGERRSDDRLNYRAELNHQIAENVSMKLKYDYVDSSSNLETQDYDEHIGSVSLSVKF